METLEKQLTTKVKVLKEEPCEVTFSIELSKEDVAQETESVFKSIQARAVLPGFSRGQSTVGHGQTQFHRPRPPNRAREFNRPRRHASHAREKNPVPGYAQG